MIRRRWSGAIEAQLAISSIVRPQPLQSRLTGSIEQTLTQGVSMSVSFPRWQIVPQCKTSRAF
jgi:hypothetical protein